MNSRDNDDFDLTPESIKLHAKAVVENLLPPKERYLRTFNDFIKRWTEKEAKSLSESPLREEYEDDSYICKDCVNKLQEAINFKHLVLETLTILERNGLIKLSQSRHRILVQKVSNDIESSDEHKYEDLITENVNTTTEIKVTITNDTSPSIEDKIKKEKEEVLKVLIPGTESKIILKNEKKFTVTGKRKGLKDRQPRPKKIEPSYQVTEDLKCKICSEVMPNVKVFHSHMNRHFPNHICETCGKGFLTEKRLKRHTPSHNKGPFNCTACPAQFTNYNTYNSHRQRTHGSGLLYSCPHCQLRFPTFTRRARHLATAHDINQPKYRCSMCPRQFLVSGNLSSHMRSVHLKQRRHVCPHPPCEAAFFHKHQLRSHIATHTGANNFLCALCDKSYPRKNALEVHMRTHSGLKPFGCDICGKRFTQKCILLKHNKMHAREQKDAEEKKQAEKEDKMPTLVIGVDGHSLNYILT